MNLFKAKNSRDRLENKLKYEISEIVRKFDKTQPGSFDLSKEIVKGGKITDKNMQYLIDTNENYSNIKDIQEQLLLLGTFITLEEERMKKYEPITYKIIELREVHNLTWKLIGIRLGITERWCQKLYEKYQEEKEIDIYVLEK